MFALFRSALDPAAGLIADLAAFFPGRRMFQESPVIAAIMLILAMLTTLGILMNVAGLVLGAYWALTSPAFIIGSIAAIVGVWLLFLAVRHPITAFLVVSASIIVGLVGHAVWRSSELVGMPLYVEAYQQPEGIDVKVAQAAAARCGARMFAYRLDKMLNVNLSTGGAEKPFRPYLALFIGTHEKTGRLLYSVERADDHDLIDALSRRLGVSDGYVALEEADTAEDIAAGVCQIVGRGARQ
jgi:hypothetical protein